jgi:hypothetical protein
MVHLVGNLLFESDAGLAAFDTDVQVLLSVCFRFSVISWLCSAAGRSVSGEKSCCNLSLEERFFGNSSQGNL